MDLGTSLFFTGGDGLQTCLNQYHLITSYYSIFFKLNISFFQYQGNKNKKVLHLWGHSHQCVVCVC